MAASLVVSQRIVKMSTNTSLGLTTLFFVVGYLIVMYYGVRDAKSKRWSFGVEATIAVFTVLIFQWLFLCYWGWQLELDSEKDRVARLGVYLLFGIPAILAVIWELLFKRSEKS